MRRYLILIGLALLCTIPATAQTPTPTRTPTPAPTWTPAPTIKPYPTLTPPPGLSTVRPATGTPMFAVPLPDINSGIGQTDQLSNLDLEAPGGSAILPDPNLPRLFGYAKWLLTFSSAEEYAGPFAPAIQHMGIALTATIALAGAYFTVWVVMWLVRFAVWLFLLVIRIVDFAAGMFSRIVELFTP